MRRPDNVAIKGTHLEQVFPAEPSRESGFKIAGQAHQKLLSVASSFRSASSSVIATTS